jgi:6,7-dimethyl-8-ribityllumazine synthase
MTILIVVADFYADIADNLVQGATQALSQASVPYEVINVPGALEIPPAVAMAAESGHYAGAIALGCVIRGETSHYDIVANHSAQELMALSVRHCLPLGQGILTVETREQALARAMPGTEKDKGRDAALACLRLRELQHHLNIARGAA